MILRSLTLLRFRNHRKLTLAPSLGANELVGANGAGKTNVLEAIDFLSLGRSWRTSDVEEVIQEGGGEAYIRGEVEEGGILRRIEVSFRCGGRAVLLDGKPLARLSDLRGAFSAVRFTPEDVSLFRGPPSGRRAFLDESLSRLSGDYLLAYGRFRHLLEERNRALKKGKWGPLLETLTERLVAEEERVEDLRDRFLQRLEKAFGKLSEALLGQGRDPKVRLKRFLEPGEGFARRAIALHLSQKERDLALGSTQSGPQRDDLLVSLDGREAASYASQGESRALALALRLAPALIPKGAARPVVLLDDVFGELDQERRRRLVALLPRLGQSFITGTTSHVAGARHIHIGKKDSEE